MPYHMVYEPAPADESLPVLKELPNGIAEYPTLTSNLREAHGHTADGLYRSYHFCAYCDGWIEGEANRYFVNTLNPQQLAGRQGTEYFCRRCGKEIGFMGVMS